jgi:hypothetical protein
MKRHTNRGAWGLAVVLAGMALPNSFAAEPSKGVRWSVPVLPQRPAPVTGVDVYITFVPRKHSVLYVWRDRLYDYANHRSVPIPDEVGGVEYAHWNAAGNRVLLGDKETAFTLDYRRLRVVRVYDDTVSAWWNGGRVERVAYNENGAQFLCTRSRRVRLPRDLIITASSEDGAMLLGKKFEPESDLGNLFILYRQRGGVYRRQGPLQPVHRHMTENPYGEFLRRGPGRDSIVFGIEDITLRDKTYVRVYRSSGKARAAVPLFHDQPPRDTGVSQYYSQQLHRFLTARYGSAHYVQPPVGKCGRQFIGVYRREKQCVNHPPEAPHYYQFVLSDGRLQTSRLHSTVLGFAVDERGNCAQMAYLYRVRRAAILEVQRHGTVVIREPLRESGEPLSWRSHGDDRHRAGWTVAEIPTLDAAASLTGPLVLGRHGTGLRGEGRS